MMFMFIEFLKSSVLVGRGGWTCWSDVCKTVLVVSDLVKILVIVIYILQLENGF